MPDLIFNPRITKLNFPMQAYLLQLLNRLNWLCYDLKSRRGKNAPECWGECSFTEVGRIGIVKPLQLTLRLMV